MRFAPQAFQRARSGGAGPSCTDARRKPGFRDNGSVWRRAGGYLLPLLALWASSSEAVNQLSIEQIVATAGNGKLRDDSECSLELRQYLSQVPR